MDTNEENLLPSIWPESGHFTFNDVSLCYCEGLPLALDGLSFDIPAGRRCGMVGRTGAGKSSITVALFRYWLRLNPERFLWMGLTCPILVLPMFEAMG